MSPQELQRYLWEHIPISRAMQVTVLAADPERVVLHAPLAPNINHRETVFGGSASAIAILSAWGALQLRMRAEGLDARLVIQRNTMEYTRPIRGEFTATGRCADPAAWPRFLRTVARYGRARIEAVAELTAEEQVVGSLRGEFVALTRTAGGS